MFVMPCVWHDLIELGLILGDDFCTFVKDEEAGRPGDPMDQLPESLTSLNPLRVFRLWRLGPSYHPKEVAHVVPQSRLPMNSPCFSSLFVVPDPSELLMTRLWAKE